MPIVISERGTKEHSHQEAYKTCMDNNNSPLSSAALAPHREKEKGKEIRKRLER